MRPAMGLANRVFRPKRTNLFSERDGVHDKETLR